MCNETNEERQDNELFALQSIYDDAVVDNRGKSVWNTWRPLNVLLTLKPNCSSKEVCCSVTLQFQCCHNYPDKPPKITVKEAPGLPNDNVQKLLEELEELATQHCGEVMIFTLAEHTIQFLQEHKPRLTLSCYDEMIQEKIEMEKSKPHILETENEEIQNKINEIEKARQGSGDSAFCSEHDSFESDVHNNAPKLVYYADDDGSPIRTRTRRRTDSVPCTCNIKSVKTLRYTQKNNKKIYIGNCIGHSSNDCTTYLAIDEYGEHLVVKSWSLHTSSDFQTRNRQMNSIQQDIKAMCWLKHSSLVPYTGMEMLTENKRTAQQIIYIYRKYISGTSLKHFLNKLPKFSNMFESLKLVRQVGLGVFSALKVLHSVNILHRDIRSEKVFLENSGGVKLVDASLDVRLTEVLDEGSYCDRHTKEQDIYAAAQLLRSLVTEESGQEIPPDLPSSAKDFFSRCLIENEHSQWSAEQLVDHGFLVDALTTLPNSRDNMDADSISEDDDDSVRIQDISALINGKSRLSLDFEILTRLGSGAFGDVLKVRNKLDGRFYAIKHVKLNPRSAVLTKKIKREVKLLSRLNHENVVRYYNAWIETITETEKGGEVQESSVVDSPTKNKGDSLDTVVKHGQGGTSSLTWSMSGGPAQARDESSDTEDDSDDDEPLRNIINHEENTSESIQFEKDGPSSETSEDEETTPPITASKQVLYIQMEFCEKKTLRQAIDKGLHHDHYKAWRLFREILEGLAHVHQQGMIHRDLKPMNIFLDSNDHVKLGDFGLATKIFTELPVEDKMSQEDSDGLLTGKVGTGMYVAPELQQSADNMIYNQKVDIYSLGIILFEMFHAPFDTLSERYSVLTNIRKEEIILPSDYQRKENSKQIHVIRWLLNHDPSVRPTSAELLASEHVPRAVSESALTGLLSHTLNQRGSRGYQKLVTACLEQKTSLNEDLKFYNSMKSKPVDIVASIKDTVIKVFQSHGATEFHTPLMTQRAKRWEQNSNAVKVMTSSGSVCYLPYDLRLPFARHIAYSGTKYMRRYVVDRVYRESDKDLPPKEMIECAFDIVSPKTDSLWPDAELLVVASRAATECSLKVTLQLNHTDLLKTLLIACGVPQDKHSSIYPVLVKVGKGRLNSLQLKTHLTTLCVTERDISNMIRFMEANVDVKSVRGLVANIGRNKWEAALDGAMGQLETVCNYADALGCDVPITVAPFLAYNATQHSGVFWQMSVVRNKHRSTGKHRSKDIIAAGGRYDDVVEDFWRIARSGHDAQLNSTSVGFSMSFEGMAAALKDMGEDQEIPTVVKNSECKSVCVCMCDGGAGARFGDETKRAQIARDLWAGGHSALCWSGSPAEAHDLTKAPMVLMQYNLKVSVAHWVSDNVHKYELTSTEVLALVKRTLNTDIVRNPEIGNRTISWPEGDKPTSPNFAVTFITSNDRMTKNFRRQCEVQIHNQITSMLVNLGLLSAMNRYKVNVLALECDEACVRTLAANLSLPLDKHTISRASNLVCGTYVKNKDILEDAIRVLTTIAKQNNPGRGAEDSATQLYALYSIPDTACRLIT